MTHDHFVLVVEDDADCRELVAELLAESGFKTETAANGAEALERLRQHRESICVIVLDLMMPIMNGWEFRAAQLKDEHMREVPVLVLTADSRAQIKVDDLAPAGYLAKPVDPGKLLELISQHCPRAH